MVICVIYQQYFYKCSDNIWYCVFHGLFLFLKVTVNTVF